MNSCYKFGIVKLLSEYWSKYTVRLDPISTRMVIVGDVHGDLNQFLPPLIASGVITLKSGDPLPIDKEMHLYLPRYEVNTETDIDVIYLGDLVDQGPSSREICLMMADIMEKNKRVKLVLGNHDLNVIALHGYKSPDIPSMLTAMWDSLKPETLELEDVSVHGNTITPSNYAVKYFECESEALFRIFNLPTSGICFFDKELNSIISHTSITNKSINELITQRSRRDEKRLRERHLMELSKEKWSEYSREIQQSKVIDEKWCEMVNTLFKHSNCEYIHFNTLVYNRIDTEVIYNSIVGHTIGGVFRCKPLIVNPIPCLFDSERELHLIPTISEKTKMEVYYFDFSCSCMSPLNDVSRPDYVIVSRNNEFRLSYLPGLCITYDFDGHLMLIEFKGKTRFFGTKSISRI